VAETEALRVNPSGVARYLRCETEWFNYTVHRIRKQRPTDSPHRDRGKALHALLEHAWLAYADTGEAYTFADAEGWQEARNVLAYLHDREGLALDEEASLEVLEAARYHLAELDMPSWEVVRLADGTPLIEADLRAPLIEGAQLQTKVDAVLRKKSTGKIWVIDWKTTRYPIDRTKTPPWLEHNYQLTMMRETLKHAGVEPDFVALAHLRSVAPQEPPLVYKGRSNERTTRSVSQLSCDWETYRATLEERGEDPGSEEAIAVREKLAPLSFSRWQVDISSEDSHAAVMRHVHEIAQRMLLLASQQRLPVVRLSHARRGGCRACDYEAWCTATLRNAGKPDCSLLGVEYLPSENSPLAGQEQWDSPEFDPAKAFVQFAADHGRALAPHEEFKP
jgi:hypothetical protein